MANELSRDPIRIDSFTADVTLSTGPCNLICMLVTAYTTAKTVTFIDSAAANVLIFEVAAGTTAQITPPKSLRFETGLVLDQSATELAAGDFIFAWIE